MRRIEEDLGLHPTGRVPKTVPSIVSKLRRESIRLTQIQDIAGCRIVVSDLGEQDRVVHELRSRVENVAVTDRRVKPSYGYRTVHVTTSDGSRTVEIQVRTVLQHQSAELSEQYADRMPGLKYGEGDAEILRMLTGTSDNLYGIEQQQLAIRRLKLQLAIATPGADRDRTAKDIAAFEADHEQLRDRIIGSLSDLQSLVKLIESAE